MKSLVLAAAFGSTLLTVPAFAQDAPPAPPGRDMFDRLDTNHDGVITKEEFQAEVAARFARLDTNHDGKVSQEERDAARPGGGGGRGMAGDMTLADMQDRSCRARRDARAHGTSRSPAGRLGEQLSPPDLARAGSPPHPPGHPLSCGMPMTYEPDMPDTPHLLLVEDERSIREPLAQYLTRQGFRITQAGDAEGARARMAAYAIDLVVLDIMMPGEDGLSLCRHIRESSDTPVILLTARGEETDRIVGLEMGADDYVVKPFSPRELAARIKVVLRRLQAGGTRQHAPDAGSFAFAGWVLKTGERALVDREGVSVPLSTGEYSLLHALVTRPRAVLTRDQLLDLTQGREAAAFDRAIDNQVSRLRKKIEPDPRNPAIIKTVWGGGYTLAAEVTRL
jgi:two-component system, OmpR family, response regulator